MVDALRADYLARGTPFLRKLQEEGAVGELVPPFGFEPDAAFISGLDPEECDAGLHYLRRPESSPFRWVRPFAPVLDSLPSVGKRVARTGIRVANLLLQSSSARRHLSRPANIPFRSLHLFDVASDKLLFEPGFAGGRSVFDRLREAGMSSRFVGAPIDRGGAEAVVSKVLDGPLCVDFLFVSLTDLDFAGHEFGPASAEVTASLAHVDDQLRRLHSALAATTDSLVMIVFGDHGMVEVTQTVDVLGPLAASGLRLGVDCELFLDSTFARLWCSGRTVRDRATQVLNELKGGSVLKELERREYQANYPHSRFGDVIWWADGGVLIRPNFFQGDAPVKGMHGYRRGVGANHGGLVVHMAGRPAHREIGSVPMKRLYPTLLDLLSLGSSVERAQSLLADG